MQGLMMGMWFLASGYGQYVAGLLGHGMSVPGTDASAMEKLIAFTDGYKTLAIYALIAGAALLILAPFVRRLMGTTK